jgi:hypothetical protein
MTTPSIHFERPKSDGNWKLKLPFIPPNRAQPVPSLSQFVEVSSSPVDSYATNKDAVKQVIALSNIEDDWNSYGAVAPNSDAIDNAAHALFILAGFGLTPSHVSPSSEGGVTLSFTEHDKCAAIEFYNTGEGAAVISKPDSETQAWDFEPSPSDYPKLARDIRHHFHS